MEEVRECQVLCLGGGAVGKLLKVLWPTAVVLEAGSRSQMLNREFGAVYLWRDIPEMETRPVNVVTTIDGQVPTVEAQNRYKVKIGKPEEASDKLLKQFKHRSQGWQPRDPRWSPGGITHEAPVTDVDVNRQIVTVAGVTRFKYRYLVNTLPLPSFLELCALTPESRPPHWPVEVIRARVANPDAFPLSQHSALVDYVTRPDTPVYRVTHKSWDSEHMDIELMYDPAAPEFTLDPTEYPGEVTIEKRRILPYGKIGEWPEADSLRLTLQARHHVYCFGRFARWFPDELLHNTLEDLRSWTVRVLK